MISDREKMFRSGYLTAVSLMASILNQEDKHETAVELSEKVLMVIDFFDIDNVVDIEAINDSIYKETGLLPFSGGTDE